MNTIMLELITLLQLHWCTVFLELLCHAPGSRCQFSFPHLPHLMPIHAFQIAHVICDPEVHT